MSENLEIIVKTERELAEAISALDFLGGGYISFARGITLDLDLVAKYQQEIRDSQAVAE